MIIHLSSELERLVSSKVGPGRFNSADEVVGEALRRMEERDPVTDLPRDEIRQKIAQGRESQRLGRLTDGEEVFARLEAELDALEANASR